MINNLGAWVVEDNYLVFPKEDWCDMDYVADYIIKQKYTPKTSMENLILNLISNFEIETEDSSSEFFPTYNDDLMINMEGIQNYAEASGGLKEFDYVC